MTRDKMQCCWEYMYVTSASYLRRWHSAFDIVLQFHARSPRQWRRQDLLWGGAKIEIMSWGTHGGLRGRVHCSSCSMTNSFVTYAALIERAVSCWHLHQLTSHTTQYLNRVALRFGSWGEHVPQCPIAGDATAPRCGKSQGSCRI